MLKCNEKGLHFGKATGMRIERFGGDVTAEQLRESDADVVVIDVSDGRIVRKWNEWDGDYVSAMPVAYRFAKVVTYLYTGDEYLRLYEPYTNRRTGAPVYCYGRMSKQVFERHEPGMLLPRKQVDAAKTRFTSL